MGIISVSKRNYDLLHNREKPDKLHQGELMGFQEKWVGLLYWAAKSPRKHKALFTPLGITLWLGLTALFIFASFKLDEAAAFPKLVPPPLNFILASPLLAFWAFVDGWTILTFLRARGSPVPLNPPQRLVTTGLYAYVRNPMLTGWFILMLGLGILLRSLSLILIFTPAFVLLNLIYLKAIEEKEMERKFGDEYLRYKREVPMFFPRFKGRKPGSGKDCRGL